MKGFILSLLITATILALSQTLTAQVGPNKQWDRSIGGTGNDNLRIIRPTNDGGYILGGISESSIGADKSQASRGNADYWVVKTDASGNKVWDKTFGGSGDENLIDLKTTSDGGYVIGGYSNSGISGDKTQNSKGLRDYWIVKIDSLGNKVWDKTLGGIDDDYLTTLQPTTDGGFMAGGYSWSGMNGDKSQPAKGFEDVWIVKLDASGNKQWDKTFGTSVPDGCNVLVQTADGGYLLGAGSHGPINGDKSQVSNSVDIWLIKIDSNGNKQWDKCIGGYADETISDLQKIVDGGYIMAGQSDSNQGKDKSQPSRGHFDYWIVKVDANGVKQWDKTFGTFEADRANSIQQTADQGYIIAGQTFGTISGDKSDLGCGNYDMWVIKTDALGAMEWNKAIGTAGDDIVFSFHQTPDGGYITGGTTGTSVGPSCDKSTTNQGSGDFWFIKLAPKCSDLSANLTANCNNNGTNVILNIAGLGSTTNSIPSWTLTYSINGVTQTATGTSANFVLAQNAPIGSIFILNNITAGTCNTALSQSITVQPLPGSATATAGSHCGPGRVPLSLTGATSGDTYVIYSSASSTTPLFTSTNGNFNSPLINGTTTYYISIANGAGCEGPRTPVVATINPLPIVTTGPTQIVCVTSPPFQLAGFSPLGGTWSGAGVSPTGLFTPSNSVGGVRTLTYSVTQNGCTASATQTITVSAEPIVIAGPNEIIPINTGPYQLTGFSPGGGVWSGPGVSSWGLFTPSIALIGVQTLTYTYSANGCTVTATKQITIPSPPAQPSITVILPDTLVSSVISDTYEWKLNGTILPVSTRKIKAVASGIYAVRVISTTNGPSIYSLDFNFIVSGIKESISNSFILFPNPTSGIVNLEVKHGKTTQVSVYNTLGQRVFTKEIFRASKEEFIQIDLSKDPKGVYTIQVISVNQVYTKKVVLQ